MENQCIPSEKRKPSQQSRISLVMRRSDLQNLPEVPSLPEGYRLRAYEKGDEPSLVATLNSAFGATEWTLERLRKELTENPNVKATFVITFGGGVVATASALFESKDTGRLAVLHWVGVSGEHRGKMLGYIVNLRVLHFFREQGCTDVILRTDSSRIPALKTYLKLGFIPEFANPEHADLWAGILTQLGPAYRKFLPGPCA